MRNALLSAKSAIASVRANPRIARRKSSSFSLGLRETPTTREEKISPIPTPTPASALVARPAPISFAATTIVWVKDSLAQRAFDLAKIAVKLSLA